MDENTNKEHSSESLPSPTPIIYENLGRSGLPKDDILLILDDIDNNVEKLRKRAFEIEEGRDVMFNALHAVRNSRLLESLSDGEFSFIKFLNDISAQRKNNNSAWMRTKKLLEMLQIG